MSMFIIYSFATVIIISTQSLDSGIDSKLFRNFLNKFESEDPTAIIYGMDKPIR